MDNNRKKCPCCGKEKAASEFGIDISRKDGLNIECRQCRSMKRRKRNGGTERALRYISDAEILGEMVRRQLVYDMLDSLSQRDIYNYMVERGYDISHSPTNKEKGGEA